MDDTLSRIKKVVGEHLGIGSERIILEANFVDDLGADSLDSIELTMAFEQEFNIDLDDTQADSLVTVAMVFEYINQVRRIHDK